MRNKKSIKYLIIGIVFLALGWWYNGKPIPGFIQSFITPSACQLVVSQPYTLMSYRAIQAVNKREPLPPVKLYNSNTKETFLADINIMPRDSQDALFTINFAVKYKLIKKFTSNKHDVARLNKPFYFSVKRKILELNKDEILISAKTNNQLTALCQ